MPLLQRAINSSGVNVEFTLPAAKIAQQIWRLKRVGMGAALRFLGTGVLIALPTACARESGDSNADSVALARRTAVTAQTPAAKAPSSPEVTVSTTASPSSAKIAQSAPLICSPATFGAGDTLTVRMSTPHGHYLTVTTSDRTAYLVVYPAQGHLTDAHSLMPSDSFASVATIRLPADIRAIPYVYGRDTILESVFSQPGSYLLEVSDSFGTDFGTAPPSCDLKFGGLSLK